MMLASCTDQLHALRERRISSVELLQEALGRIDALNPVLNAVVAQDREAALSMSAASDARYATGSARPLEGLPVTIKDAFEVAGFAATCGVPALADHRPAHDAPAVARLRDAGVVVIGKTNVPPFSADWQTGNDLFGRTNNPWDVTRTPGGSSGGAVAAVATGMTSFELGSDIAGSIRWPSHATGVFGHKSTWGLVDMRGHIPPAPWFDDEPDLVVAGPLTRSAADLSLLMSMLSRDPVVPFGKPVNAWRLGMMTSAPGAATAQSVVDSVEYAAAALTSMGAYVEPMHAPFHFEAVWRCYLSQLCRMHHASRAGRERREWASRAGEFADDDMSPSAWLAHTAERSDADLLAELEPRERWLEELRPFFAEFDALLMPPAPTLALPHDPRGYDARPLVVDGEERSIFEMTAWTAPATVLHLPSTTAPVTRCGGLPCGVQILGPRHGDAVTIAVAAAIETATGGFVAPPCAATLS
jgi:amidase